MVRGAAEPVRMCCGCKKREAQRSLVRVTTVNGVLVLDLERRRGGRGLYVHPAPVCWSSFVRGKGYVQSLRRRVGPAERELLGETLRAAFGQDGVSVASNGG